MNPYPDVHLTAGQLAEHHSDLVRAVERDQPHSVFGVDSSYARTDFVVEGTCGAARPVGCDMHVLGARGEDVAVGTLAERAKVQAFAGARRALAKRERQLLVQVIELSGDLASRRPCELVQ